MSPFLLHIALISALDLIGVLTAKLWHLHRNPWLLVATVVCFGGAGFVFARSLKFEGMAITNVLWIAISIIVVTLMGYFIFKEEIAHIQIAGIVVITIGLVLINLK